MAIARAAVFDLVNYGHGRRPIGASTITQQVAKNMLLGNEVSVARKVKEMILALRIDQTMSEGAHSRALSERNLSWAAVLWRRRGGARRISTRPSTS